MELLGLILLFALNIFLICDDRKRYAELRKYKKMIRQGRREARKEFWQKMRTRLAKPRKEEPDSGAVLKETKQRYQNVVLDFSFPEYRQENLDFINKTLSRYALKDVTVTDHSGALVKDENGIGHYTLKRCTLSCDLMPSGPGLDLRISTMVASITVQDCGLLWQQKNPDRKLCRKVFRHLGNAYALVVVHHDKAMYLPKREIIPRDRKPQACTAPVPPKKAPPVRSDSKTKYCCGRPGKDTLVFRYEDGTLYIEGQGRLRCGQWPWLTAPIRHVVIAPGCTAIGAFAFLHCRSLETIVLPDTLRTIGERAFAYCTNLREVTIPDSVTGISKGVFDHCENLARVYLPRNLAQIHSRTFCCCEGLQDVQIPDSVHYIGTRAFYRVKSVKNLPRNLGDLGTRSPGYSKRPYGLGEEAFAYAGLPDHIEIPDGMDTLPERAFWGCETLVSVTLPRSLREIGEGAFGWCSSLTGIALPETVTKINRSVFRGCRSLASITLPKDLTEIGSYAFCECASLTGITLPESVVKIGEYAFRNCESLVSLELPDSVTKLGEGAFEWTGIVHAVLPRHMGWIPNKLFHECQALRSAVLPDGIACIGVSAFDGCGALEEIRIPDRVTSIERRAFHSCVKLTSLKLPEGLTSLGSAAFACCSGLTEMVIPSGLTYIPQSAFASCTGLTSVTIPDSVTQIAIWGFTGCTALKDLHIPATVTFIGTSAFTDVPGIIYHGPSEGLNNWGALSRNGISTEHKPVTVNQILWENKRCSDERRKP